VKGVSPLFAVGVARPDMLRGRAFSVRSRGYSSELITLMRLDPRGRAT
jgi:hypothetical protein